LILNGLGYTDKKIILQKGYCENSNAKGLGKRKIAKTRIEYGKDSLAFKIFDEFLQQVKKDNIKIVFVYTPLYKGITEKIVDVDEMISMYYDIARKYDIPIIDYSNDELSLNMNYYLDEVHLNKTGAEIFSAKLAKDIDSLGILK